MIEFNIVDRKLRIDAQTLTVAAFNEIWEYDTSKSKGKASNMLVYVFHCCDITERNPFRDLPEASKELYAKKNAFGKQDYKFPEEEERLIDAAKQWYNVLNKNSILRFSWAIDRKIDQMADFMLNPENDITNIDQYESQAAEIAKVDKILQSKKRTDEFVLRQLEKTKIKGGQTLSPLEQGLLDG